MQSGSSVRRGSARVDLVAVLLVRALAVRLAAAVRLARAVEFALQGQGALLPALAAVRLPVPLVVLLPAPRAA